MLKVFSYISTSILFSFMSSFGYAQVRKGDTREFKAVYDSLSGIAIYEALNMNTGGDSTRNDAKGYVLQGWIEDYYPDGKTLHKGFYIDGQLKAYKNFYPNGQMEREFKGVDLSRNGLNVYYEDGKKKSLIIYMNGHVIKEEDYFNSGQLEYVEEYDKKGIYYIQRKFFNINGKPTSLLEITDTKKKIYTSQEYYDNGNMKEEGEMIFNEGMGDYQKNGKWKFYNENGTFKEEKTFSKGDEGG